MNRRLFPRRKRTWGIALALGALLLALPVTDVVAATLTEHRIADRIAERQKAVVGTPRVSIDGFPFLLHSAQGTFPQVTVSADATTNDGQPVQASIRLSKVTDIAGTYEAASADAEFTVPYSALSSSLGGSGTSLSADDKGRLSVNRTIFGMPLIVIAELRLSGRTITVVPVEATFAGRTVDPKGPRIAAAFADKKRTVPALPAGLTPTSVSATTDGVTLQAHAADVTLGKSTPQN